jgi:putative transposase
MDIVEELNDPQVPIAQACAALGLSRATLYRNTQLAKPAAAHAPAPSPRRLSDLERQTVLDVMHSEEFGLSGTFSGSVEQGRGTMPQA